MLVAMQQDNRLQKVPTDTVLMTPKINTAMPLGELNSLIAEQKGIPIDELASLVGGAPKVKEKAKVEPTPLTETQPVENVVLTDKDLAKNYRSQADSMYKEAAKLRKQADELDPPQKKATKVKETSDA
jgi:hypothetical protein